MLDQIIIINIIPSMRFWRLTEGIQRFRILPILCILFVDNYLTLNKRACTPNTKVCKRYPAYVARHTQSDLELPIPSCQTVTLHQAVLPSRGRYHTNLLTHQGESRGRVTVTSRPLQNNSAQNLKCHSDVVRNTQLKLSLSLFLTVDPSGEASHH